MPDAYTELLDATIQHLEKLKSDGVRYVNVSPESLAALAKMPARRSSGNETATTPPVLADGHQPPERVAPSTAQVQSSDAGTVLRGIPPYARKGTAPPRPPTDPAKLAAFAELRERAMACVKCPKLAASRKNVVFGVGNVDAELMFVGEAPGADEDEQGEPFVGKAGQLLTKIIQTMGFPRDSVYIANILKCRPDTPGQSAGNRKPSPGEMETCIPFLHEQIDLIKPKVLVALGGTAVDGLLGKTIGIMKLRGNWRTYRGIPLMPTYHPAYLLRNQALAEKRRVWEDMLQVLEKLGAPISEKQRNYFLNA